MILNKVTDCYLTGQDGKREEIQDDKLYHVVTDLYTGQMLGSVMDISYGAYSTATNIENGTYTETSQSFQFDKGTIGNTNYIAIAANSGNVAGAQVAINEMLDPEVQADRFTEIRTIPVVDYNKLNDTQKEAFDKVEIGKGVIPQDELLSKRLPEMPSALVPIIEEIWAEEVVGK